MTDITGLQYDFNQCKIILYTTFSCVFIQEHVYKIIGVLQPWLKEKWVKCFSVIYRSDGITSDDSVVKDTSYTLPTKCQWISWIIQVIQ